MKRTRDGGAILENEYGEETKLTPEEFRRGCMIRDLIRILLILPFLIAYGIFQTDCLFYSSIGLIFIMVGWRLKTGW